MMMTSESTRPRLTVAEKQMLVLVALAASSYPAMQAKDPEPIAKSWAMMMRDIPVEILKAAIVKVCRESEFFPSVAMLVAAAHELDPRNPKLPTAAEAWAEVTQQVCDAGIYRAPTFSCDTVQKAVRAIGWRQLCVSENPEADRAHFMRIYESMRSKHRESQELNKALELSGMADVVKALASGMSA